MTRAWWCLGLCISLAACSCAGEPADEEGERAPSARLDDQGRVVLNARERSAAGLVVAEVEQGSLTTRALRFGKVVARPQEDVLVAAPIAGRVLATTALLGAHVNAGDVLIMLEPLVDPASHASLQAQRRELVGQIAGARAQTVAKQADLQRVSALASSALATGAEAAQAQAELSAEQARVDSLTRANAELARATTGRMAIRAPVAGELVMIASDTGSLAAQGAVLARIVLAGPRWIDIAVPPDDPVGSGYRVSGLGQMLDAKLLSRGAVIGSDGTRRDRLEASADAAGYLPPGATIAVDVLHDTHGVIVPASAIVRRGRDSLAFVEQEAGRFAARRVEVSAREDERAVVSAGLSAGDLIATRGAASLLGELGMTRLGSDGGAAE